MPFLTLEDPNARIKGSRDPLGAQPVWAAFARHVVTNLTGAANSVRAFSILLLGRYYAQRLIENGSVAPEHALDVVLRMEQIGAYARFKGHGVTDDIRGIERVKRFEEENGGRVYIETGRRGLILSDQRIYGIWGLFTVSARVSGLIPDGPAGVTDRACDLIEAAYLPHLRAVEAPLLKLLARGGRLEVRGRDPLFAAICRVLPESYTAREAEFYGRTLRDGLEVQEGANGGRQALFSRLLRQHTRLTRPVTREEVVSLAEGAEKEDRRLGDTLRRIIHLESLLAPADALFDYLLTRDGQRPEAVSEDLLDHWGPEVPNLDSSAFDALTTEIESASTPKQAMAMRQCQIALRSGKYDSAIRAVIEWNTEVMKRRESAPWVRVSDRNRIEVRYRGAEHLLLEQDELPTLWRNQYFFDSLKKVTRQLGNVA
jgi:hypothetical protein